VETKVMALTPTSAAKGSTLSSYILNSNVVLDVNKR
jgi:hypothetical protein